MQVPVIGSAPYAKSGVPTWEAPLRRCALLKDSLALSKRIYTAASPARLHFTYGLTNVDGWGGIYVLVLGQEDDDGLELTTSGCL